MSRVRTGHYPGQWLDLGPGSAFMSGHVGGSAIVSESPSTLSKAEAAQRRHHPKSDEVRRAQQREWKRRSRARMAA